MHLAKDYSIERGRANHSTWKIHFEKYRKGSSNYEFSIVEDFEHLKGKHGLDLGKYKALLDMFQHIDDRAVTRIRQDSAKINELLAQHESPESTYMQRRLF